MPPSRAVALLALLALLACAAPRRAAAAPPARAPLSAGLAAVAWTSCAPETSALEVGGVALTPERVAPGSSAAFSVDVANVGGAAVRAGALTLTVRKFGITIHTEHASLCEHVGCPLDEGAGATVVYEKEFPAITPAATYAVRFSGASGSTPLFCVEFSVKVERGGGGAAEGEAEAEGEVEGAGAALAARAVA
jgi:hypothetical protein